MQSEHSAGIENKGVQTYRLSRLVLVEGSVDNFCSTVEKHTPLGRDIEGGVLPLKRG
jgi:hypothetical protein